MFEEKFSFTDAEKLHMSKEEERVFIKLEELCGVQILSRNHGVIVRSANFDAIEMCRKIFDQIRISIGKNLEVSNFYLEQLYNDNSNSEGGKAGKQVQQLLSEPILRNRFGQAIQAKTSGQVEMVKAVAKSDIVFVEGPAGTGKTFLAVCLAIAALEDRRVDRLSLVRPAVEAGENLGFLPGDLKEKIAPYLRPLYDAINEMLPKDKVKAYQETNTIEVAPLAYMRGRTLKRAFVILDEAQNTTISQMKMFLTRIGTHSRVIITGDPTQIDLPPKQASGFSHAIKTLQDIHGISHIKLTEGDVLRHPLVKKIITAYERVGA
jgi:phosphate starvation-inducible protein PhoH and related proteins